MGVKNIQGQLTLNGSNVITEEQLQEIIDSLALVAKSGLIEDLSMLWDTELIFDGGSADVQLAILDETILL